MTLSSMALSTDIIALLFFVGGVAGFVDAIAGGGGLITVPILMLSGMSPTQALGTNKFQACFGSFSASMHFYRRGLVSLGRSVPMILSVAIAAAVGAALVQRLDAQLLLRLMPIVFIAMAVYTLFSARLGAQEATQRVGRKTYAACIAPLIGFCDGFAGPGTGTFFALSLVKLRGMDFVRATAQTKVLNFTSNVVSLFVFVAGGQIVWAAGLAMATGQFVGAQLGARTAIRRGSDFIRVLTVVVCIATSVGLLMQAG